MKKTLKFVLITIILLILTYILFSIICYYTGGLRLFKNSSDSNLPNIKYNQTLYMSSLLKPENGDFIGYKFEDSTSGEHIRIHRVLGKENDTIQIINGEVFVNNINMDDNINLVHYYKLSKNTYEEIYFNEDFSKEHIAYAVDNELIYAVLDTKVAKKYNY